MIVVMPGYTQRAIVAHQGGWDEALMVVGPLLVIAGLLWLANRRANELAGEAADQADDEPTD